MSNSSGSGSQQAQTRHKTTGKQAPFIVRLLKILGACILAIFAFHFFKIFGLFLVALLIIGLFMLNKKTGGNQITLRGTIREIGATISEFLGMIITICGILVVISSLTPPAFFLIVAGSVMIIAGLMVWIKTYLARR